MVYADLVSFFRLHIRRGDKIKENSFVDISQYMFQVEKWYRGHQLNLNKKGIMIENFIKRVFVATDDKSILTKLKNKLVFKHFYIQVTALKQINV